ncbi:MAG TPA: HNH endonuclease family protein, partial [Candidatus Paceibacterota bacterium]|nr:HNH endonuclease family protein [Candidatus Paceibacterota bacterium]
RKCFDFFNERLIEYFRNNTHEKSEEICWKLKEKIEQNLVFVVVDVNTDVDAYTIFESINAKRQGLTTSDLLKNFIFSAADQIEKDKPDSKKLSKTEDLWDRMEQDLEKTEINQYIRHYWVSNYEKVFEKELYQQIKIRFQSNYPEILSFFEKVVSESEIYSSIIAGEVSALTKGANKALEQLRQLRNRQYYPLVLSALTSEKISDEVSQLIIDISSVAVRRSIIGKNPNELESFFSENASKLRRKEITIFDLRQTLFKDFWINDEQILLELRSMDFSDQEYLAKFILKEYEIDKGVEEKKLGKVSLEHVLPRNPENLDDWGITEDKKNEIVWNLGNLALIGQTYNSKMSNKSFKKKLPFLKKSEIKTTASIATLENWDEGSILERNNKLGDFIVKCWKKS